MFGRFEPVLNAATVGAFLSAVLTAIAVFVPSFTKEQQTAVAGLGGALILVMFGSAAVARQQVTPVAKVEENIIPLVAPHNQEIATDSLNTGVKSVRAEVLG